MDMLRTFLIGIAIGMANVIPGVSGGTLAVVFNIYDKFVNAVTYNVKALWKNRRFVVPLVTGMLLGVLLFSKLITVLYTHFPVQTNYAFTGLIIGSIPLLIGYTFPHGPRAGAASAKSRSVRHRVRHAVLHYATLALCIAAGIALILWFSALEGTTSRTEGAQFILPPLSVRLAVRIFIAGVIGAIAMIIPGISGSLVMLIMGVYTIIITSIPALFNPETLFHALFLLLPNGIGVLLGLISGAKLVSWLIKTVPTHTYAVILGLLVGSALTLFPGVSALHSAAMAAASALCLLLGAATAFFCSRTDSAHR